MSNTQRVPKDVISPRLVGEESMIYRMNPKRTLKKLCCRVSGMTARKSNMGARL
ncbi:MAG: hypothetical protein LKI21_07540 [Bifidobacterium crudilactis]|jgi:hypothetical protein|nr:hypothetical protein [Bifidobacterium crudilactis]